MSSQHKLPGYLQFGLYAVVGGSGFVVNTVALYLINTVVVDIWGRGSVNEVLFPLPFTDFNIRLYHLFIAVSFLIANVWNFFLNKRFTFSRKDIEELDGVRTRYTPFLVVGLFGLAVSALVTTLMMNPTSPLHLPDDFFDDSSVLRNRLYWANAAGIIVSTPVTFLVNKYWTFTHRPKADEAVRDETPVELHD